MFDILDLIVMIEIYVNSDEQIILNQYLEKLFQSNLLLEQVYAIYKIAISINNKFYLNSNKSSLNKLEKIRLIFDLILKGYKECTI